MTDTNTKLDEILYRLRPRLFDRNETPKQRIEAVEQAREQIKALLVEARVDELSSVERFKGNLQVSTYRNDRWWTLLERIEELEAQLQPNTKNEEE